MNDTTTVTHRPRRASPPIARIAAAIAAATAIAACGSTSLGSSSSGGQANLNQAQAQQDTLNFARCMRSHEVSNFPDDLNFQNVPGINPSSPAFKNAQTSLPTPAASKEPSPGRAVRADAREAASALELPARTWIPGHARPEAQPPSTGRVARGQPLQRPLWGGRLLDRDPEGRRRTRRRVRAFVAQMPRKPLTRIGRPPLPSAPKSWFGLARRVQHHRRGRAAPIAPPARTRQSASREAREAEAALLGTRARFVRASRPAGTTTTRSPAPSGFATRWPISMAGECLSPFSGSH